MIKLIKNLSIPLLFAFLSFTFIHFTHSLPQSHTDVKAVINIDDGKVKDQWENEKKLPVVIQTVIVMTTVLTAAVTPLIYLFIHFDKSFIFLIPKLYQSNYVIQSPLSFNIN
ncbi:hypothetical protein [Neobacillus drentensis]|uniref:hypothetical protein n=1 Tax=Neobacillus drentensis TaxID=220684 RepID=UPI00300182ED